LSSTLTKLRCEISTLVALDRFISLGGNMPNCPECESPLDFEPDEVDEGDVVVCDECGTEFEVITTEPLEIAKVEDEYGDGDLSGDNEEEE
jgi:alpha-aminoadipate carrier protein LysW